MITILIMSFTKEGLNTLLKSLEQFIKPMTTSEKTL